MGKHPDWMNKKLALAYVRCCICVIYRHSVLLSHHNIIYKHMSCRADAELGCSLSEGRSRPRKESGLKAPLRAHRCDALCVYVCVYAHVCACQLCSLCIWLKQYLPAHPQINTSNTTLKTLKMYVIFHMLCNIIHYFLNRVMLTVQIHDLELGKNKNE